MMNLQDLKFINVTPPAVIVDNAAFTTAIVDSVGFDELAFIVSLGALDIAVAALKLRVSDDSGMSGAVDVPGADFSVLPATLPGATDDNKVFAIFIDKRNVQERYFDLSLTGGDGSAGTYASVLCILSRPKESPNSADDRGLAQYLIP